MIKQSSIYTLQRTCENEDNYRYCSHNILLSLASKVKLMQMLMTFLPSHVKKNQPECKYTGENKIVLK